MWLVSKALYLRTTYADDDVDDEDGRIQVYAVR